MAQISEISDFLSSMEIQFEMSEMNETEVSAISSVTNIKEKSITWIKSYDEKYFENIKRYQSVVVVTTKEIADKIDWKNFILVPDPKMVFFEIAKKFFCRRSERTVSKLSSVQTNKIGINVGIGNFCTIIEDVQIGNNVEIGNNVQIICPTIIGDNCTIASGVVIGTNGFGYYRNLEGNNDNVPHTGGVIIERNVDIGANTCIDRGTIDDTFIGEFSKIDNLCHIAHNARIGKNVFIIAQSMIGGSVTLEDNVYIAPGVSIKNQLCMREKSMAGMGAVVTKDVESNVIVTGVPAKKYKNRDFL